jgi:hypothetical protein
MRVIFSIYINFNEDDFEKNSDYKKNIKNTHEFKNNYSFLKNKQEEYAKHLKVPYILYENDEKWKEYKKHFLEKYPFVSQYNVVNFYKIHLMYNLCEIYDEILYLDFDVVPATKDNIFEEIDIKKGIACKINHERDPEKYLILTSPKIIKRREQWFMETGRTFSERDPRAKYWNCRALLINQGYNGNNDVYNTGIVLANKNNLYKLKYFDTFEEDIKLMHQLKHEESFWPKFIQKSFGYDNETLFSFKMKINSVNLIELDDVWHFTYRKNINYISRKSKMIHVINKKFKYVKQYVKKNNL